MFQTFYNKLRYRTKQDFDNINSYKVEYDEKAEFTDEIEKALWDIKESWDLPTEEIEIAVESRHRCIQTKPLK